MEPRKPGDDPKDAQVILHMLRIGAEQFYHDPLVRGTNDLRELSKTPDIVSRSKTELGHRILTHYLPPYFPEADRFHRSSRSDWLPAFLERYPSPHVISAMGRDVFIADARAVVGRRVSKERLSSDIHDRAAASVGLPVEPDSDAVALVGRTPHRGLRRTVLAPHGAGRGVAIVRAIGSSDDGDA